MSGSPPHPGASRALSWTHTLRGVETIRRLRGNQKRLRWKGRGPAGEAALWGHWAPGPVIHVSLARGGSTGRVRAEFIRPSLFHLTDVSGMDVSRKKKKKKRLRLKIPTQHMSSSPQRRDEGLKRLFSSFAQHLRRKPSGVPVRAVLGTRWLRR